MPQLITPLVLCSLLSETKGEAAEPPPPSSSSAPVSSVVVTSRRLSVETLMDRKVYSLTGELQSSFGSLSDVLADIPSVNVDPDGNLTLRGDGVLILVDGKPSALFSGPRAGENLLSYPAANIERIEVLTTPPPQYRSAGAGGIINLITRRKRTEGSSGSVRANLGNNGRQGVGGHISHRTDALNVSVDAGYRHSERRKRLESILRTPLAPVGATQETHSTLIEDSRLSMPGVDAHLEYALDSLDTVTAAFSWQKTGWPRHYPQTTLTTDATGTVVAASSRFSRGHYPEVDMDERLGYGRKLARPGEELAISVHRSTSHTVRDFDYVDETVVPAGVPVFSFLVQRESSATSEGGLDYVLPFSGNQVLKVGYLFQKEDYEFGNAEGDEDAMTGERMLQAAAGHTFKMWQRTQAVYGSYQGVVGAWSLLGGLRVEGSRAESELTDGMGVRSEHWGVFPSLHVERTLGDAGTVSLGASRRVSRPDPGQLDPYVNQEYTLILRAGNPALLPEYTQSYELGYAVQEHGNAFEVTGYFRRHHDTATGFFQYLGNGLALSTQQNLPRNDHAGMEVSIRGHLGALSYGVSGDFYQRQVDAGALGPGLRTGRGVDAKLKLDYRPSARDTVQVSVRHMGRQLDPMGYTRAWEVVNVGYRHLLREDLAALITISDLLNAQRTEGVQVTPTFTFDIVRAVRGPAAYVGVVYSFGGSASKQADFQYE